MISQQVDAYKIRAVDPGKTTDCGGFGVAPDGQTYVIKSPKKHPLLPATEAFCESLAIACQLPTTVGAWVEVGGDSCYGSRFEGGLSQALTSGSRQEVETRKRAWSRCTTPGIATAAFAFDLFVFNYDRHANNWAFQVQNGNITARIFDFSKAWWVLASDPAALPSPEAMKQLPQAYERTCMTFRSVSKWVGVDHAAAQNVIDSLHTISPTWVERQIKNLPTGWIDDQTLNRTLQWWSGPQRSHRLSLITQGLKNGTLF